MALSVEAVADYLTAGHTAAQAAKRFHTTERTVYRIKARVAAPEQASSPSTISIRRYLPRPADEVAGSSSWWLAADGELQHVPIGTTGAQWNDLQLCGVPLPALCPVLERVVADDVLGVTDSGSTFEALQSSKVDDTIPDIEQVPDMVTVPFVVAPAVASASSGAVLVVNSSAVVDLLGNVWSWAIEHPAFVQLVVAVAIVGLLVGLGVH
jgi:carbamoylphosphate synthase large subunit